MKRHQGQWINEKAPIQQIMTLLIYSDNKSQLRHVHDHALPVNISDTFAEMHVTAAIVYIELWLATQSGTLPMLSTYRWL